jgi:hypothetical protein
VGGETRREKSLRIATPTRSYGNQCIGRAQVGRVVDAVSPRRPRLAERAGSRRGRRRVRDRQHFRRRRRAIAIRGRVAGEDGDDPARVVVGRVVARRSDRGRAERRGEDGRAHARARDARVAAAAERGELRVHRAEVVRHRGVPERRALSSETDGRRGDEMDAGRDDDDDDDDEELEMETDDASGTDEDDAAVETRETARERSRERAPSSRRPTSRRALLLARRGSHWRRRSARPRIYLMPCVSFKRHSKSRRRRRRDGRSPEPRRARSDDPSRRDASRRRSLKTLPPSTPLLDE